MTYKLQRSVLLTIGTCDKTMNFGNYVFQEPFAVTLKNFSFELQTVIDPVVLAGPKPRKSLPQGPAFFVTFLIRRPDKY